MPIVHFLEAAIFKRSVLFIWNSIFYVGNICRGEWLLATHDLINTVFSRY